MLRALVVMEDEAAVVWRILPANRLPYRVDRDLLGDALGHRPAHDLAGEGVYHGCEIEPPFACGHVGDVAHPKPVALAHGESALYQVQPRVSRLDLLLELHDLVVLVDLRRSVSGERVISHLLVFAAGAIDCALSLTGLNTGKLLEAISGNDFLNAFRKRQELRAKTEELVSALLPEVANRAVLFIDELDRCRPEFAMQLLEQTKSLFLQDNIMVVYSTDRTQLAYSLQGVYGQNYDCQRYLQRFCDHRFDLPRINPITYLEAKQADIHSGYCFTKISQRFIEQNSGSLRDCNRFIGKLNQGAAYMRKAPNPQRNWPISFAMNALLPTFLTMEEYAPEQWELVKTGKRFDHVFEFAKENDKFMEYLDLAIQGERKYIEKGDEPTDDIRTAYIEDLCAEIFLDSYDDPRLKRSEEMLHIWGSLDKKTLRTLTFPESVIAEIND